MAGVLLALIGANTVPETYAAFLYEWPHPSASFSFLINDIFMVFFFGLVTKEITQNCLPGGALHPLKKAINPLLGTLGGVVTPIVVYLIYIGITRHKELLPGWGIPTATDIALAWLVARAAFGAGHPAVSFLLLLAIVDDGVGLFIIAFFYPNLSHPVTPVYLLLVLIGMGVAYLLREKAVGSCWPYLLAGGGISWLGLYFSGVHPALALVPIIPFLPARDGDETAPFHTFERFFKKPVLLGLIGFGLANAGVAFSSIGPATWAVLLALLIGKTVGVFTFSYVAIRLGFPLPSGMTVKALFVAALTAAIGMTVALFVAGIAFTDPTLQGAAKMGALFSFGIAPVVLFIAKRMRLRA